MKQNPFKKYEHLLPFLSVPIILAVCWFLWTIQSPGGHSGVRSVNGIWDARGVDFRHQNARLLGPVEFIPDVFLTPDEFAAAEDEIIIGLSGGINQFATSRVRIIMPEDGYYTFTRISTQHADRIFVNGLWLHDVGTPGETREDEVPRTARITFTARPEYIDGLYIIEIVQQNSNFFHRVEGTPQHWNVGRFAYYDSAMRRDYAQNIILGFFLAMSIIYLMLFFLLRGYRANLYFALFCFTWFLRTGVTNSRVFTTIFPWLGNTAMLRIEYLSLPVSAALICAIIHDLFPGVIQKYFLRGLYIIMAGWAVIFLFGDSLFISFAVVYCQPMFLPAIPYLIVRFAMKWRSPTVAQMIFLIGASLFLYSIVRDMLFWAQIDIGGTRLWLPPYCTAGLSNVMMLAFTLCKAVTLFSTTMKQVEEARAAEEKAIRHLIAHEQTIKDIQVMMDAAPISMNIYDENMCLIDTNETAVKLSKYGSKAELLEDARKGLALLLPPYQPCGTPSSEVVRQKLALAEAEGFTRFEFLHVTKDGEEYLTDSSVVCVNRLDSRIWLTYAMDLRPIMEAEKQRVAAEITALERLSRIKTDFLNDIKHEVRNPLHIISIGTDFTNQCLSKGGMEDEVRNMQRIIQDEAIRLGRMIEGMVELATESGEPGNPGGLRRQRTDVEELLKTSVQNNRFVLERRGNTLRQEIAPDLPYVYVDAIQLTRVLQNLFSNAAAAAENANVTLSAKADESYVTVCVSDTGEGIPTELLPDVFKRGISAKGGKGYGLSICKTIVEAHSGTIEIESEQGKGTSVIFTIPVYGGQSEETTV